VHVLVVVRTVDRGDERRDDRPGDRVFGWTRRSFRFSSSFLDEKKIGEDDDVRAE
jgi:hypothetical protein